MIGLLLYILILALVFGLVIWVIGMLPLPEPFGTVARVVVGVIFLLIVLSWLFGALPAPHPMWGRLP